MEKIIRFIFSGLLMLIVAFFKGVAKTFAGNHWFADSSTFTKPLNEVGSKMAEKGGSELQKAAFKTSPEFSKFLKFIVSLFKNIFE